MIEIMKDVPPGIIAVRAVGTLTKDEYDAVVVPHARRGDPHRSAHPVPVPGRTRLPGADPERGLGGRPAGAAGAAAVRGLRGGQRPRLDPPVERAAAFFMPCPVQVFGEHEREQAIKWLSSMPEQPAIEHRLIPESGVVVVEVSQPLRAPDFDALGLTVDSWLDTHERLPGLVLHARAFPGWENIGGLVRHIRFVRDHHRKISRVAVVRSTDRWEGWRHSWPSTSCRPRSAASATTSSTTPSPGPRAHRLTATEEHAP